MAVPVVLSASSVATFLRCGQQWYYAYIEQRKSPPNIRQVLGIATHGAIEHNYQQKVESKVDLHVDEVIAAFSDQYDTQIPEVEAPDEDPGQAKDDGVRMVGLYQKDVAPKIQPYWVERPVAFDIDGIPWSGVIDLVEEKQTFSGPQRVVRDTKTTARKPSGANHQIAMTGYAIAYRHETGDEEADVVLDFLVRTKTPQYVPLHSGGPVSDQQIVAFAEVAKQVSDAITRGDFLPNGLYSQACSWCGYADICPAYRRFNK